MCGRLVNRGSEGIGVGVGFTCDEPWGRWVSEFVWGVPPPGGGALSCFDSISYNFWRLQNRLSKRVMRKIVFLKELRLKFSF